MNDSTLDKFNYSENSLQFNPNYIKFVDLASHILLPGMYTLSATSNLLVIVCVLLFKFKKRFYIYLTLKSLTSMLISIILVFNIDPGCAHCALKTYNTFMYHFYEVFLLRISINILAMMTGLTELILTYERYCAIQNKSNWFTVTSLRYICSSIVVGSIFIYLPEFYVFKFELISNNTYQLSRTPFGISKYYAFYFVTCSSFAFLLLPLYVILILVVAYKFKRFLERKRSLTSRFKINRCLVSNNENNITKFIIITGILYVLSTVIYVIATALARFDAFKKYYYDFFSVFIRFGSLFFVPCILTVNALGVFFFDSNIRRFKKDMASGRFTSKPKI